MSFPYPEAAYQPIWGAPTSVNNYCEEDYIVTGWVGEFINTWSNLIYVYYGIMGLRRLETTAHSRHAKAKYYGLLAVGLGSGAFHGLLKFHAQMTDDLSMVFATGAVLHRVLTYQSSEKVQTQSGYALFSFLISFSIWHVVTGETLAHAIIFGLMVVTVGLKIFSISKKHAEFRKRQTNLFGLAVFGAVSFVSGYIIWLTDNQACDSLNHFKRVVGMPWGFLLELHGWWHILTGVGAYTFMALTEYLTEESGQSRYGFAWPVNMYLDQKLAVD